LEKELGLGRIDIIRFPQSANPAAKFKELEDKGKANGVDFVIFINPWTQKSPYDEFRKTTDLNWGIPLICITKSKLWSNQEPHRLPGFVANNAMKINSRMNGIYHIADFAKNLPASVKMIETIIIGADVSHPGVGATPGTGSIAAMVGTVDQQGQLYAGSARPNEPRIEASVTVMGSLEFKY
jgi:eukaryotic translation initiation factor 2C